MSDLSNCTSAKLAALGASITSSLATFGSFFNIILIALLPPAVCIAMLVLIRRTMRRRDQELAVARGYASSRDVEQGLDDYETAHLMSVLESEESVTNLQHFKG